MELGERRVLHPGRFRWLRALGWAPALLFGMTLAFGPPIEALGGLLPDTEAVTFLVRALGAAVALGAYALLVRAGEDRAPSELALRPALPSLAVGLALGALMMAVVMGLLALSGTYEVTWLGWTSAWEAAGLAVQAGVVEELIVRGIILRLVWRAFGPWAAFAVSAVLFGAGHLANPGATVFAALCIALEAGVMLGALYVLTGRLWTSIGVHVAWNLTQGYVFGAAVSGGDTGSSLARSVADPDAPLWLSGGEFGPEASLAAVLVCTAVGVLALVLARRAGRFARPAPEPTDAADADAERADSPLTTA
ncbi:membrane protein [Cellulomonas cellasea DSM 20118]|uniref:Membrane protein n=2 Tax=Cellulomonas cellasea TaxID=43670 RepID=A0A0A0B9D3_9CELL|nr:membrane protein [Cellulomonas cellasea DSM 20118]